MVLLFMVGVVRAQEIEPGAKIFFNSVRAFGPIIPSIELNHNHTVGESLYIARQAGLKADKSFAFTVELEKYELAAPGPQILSLKNVPLSVALLYICDGCNLDFSYQNGLWRVIPRGPEGQDERQITVKNITTEEYTALGLRFTEKGQLVTEDGMKRPTGEIESAARLDDKLIIRALPERIENFKALLRLHRAGVKKNLSANFQGSHRIASCAPFLLFNPPSKQKYRFDKSRQKVYFFWLDAPWLKTTNLHLPINETYCLARLFAAPTGHRTRETSLGT